MSEKRGLKGEISAAASKDPVRGMVYVSIFRPEQLCPISPTALAGVIQAEEPRIQKEHIVRSGL